MLPSLSPALPPHTERAKELTEMNKGKHHIGDFLPPEELSKFMEKVNAVKEGRTPGDYILLQAAIGVHQHMNFALLGL